MTFRFRHLEIPDVVLIESEVFSDPRGFLMEAYKHSTFHKAGIGESFVQMNHSQSTCGVLRGLHYQHPPFAQGKLVYIARGEIFDVAVDLRVDSPTYAKWVGCLLSDRNPQLMYIPPGFAHGFCTLSKEANIVYLATAEYSPAYEAGLLWSDSDLDIRWPIQHPTVSERDAGLPPLRKADIRFAHPSNDIQRGTGRKR